jgi:hypothetical protein
MMSVAVSPESLPGASGSGIGNPAADAVATEQWHYPNLIRDGAILHAGGFARTTVDAEYTT